MERRDLLKLTGLALTGLAAPQAALAQGGPPAGPAAGGLDLTFMHVWADENGDTHVKLRPLAKSVKPIPTNGAMDMHFDSRPFVALHKSPQRMFVITLQGEFEIEGSDGTRHKAPKGGLSFIEDITGKGHMARLANAVNINIAVPPGFDVLRWASGEA
ncbi:MAG TPA: hypothetical protein VL358_14075 [Caulobacteraceae bacterium]|nr:hypothetical protein [Caulobacteraceae bacterium]